MTPRRKRRNLSVPPDVDKAFQAFADSHGFVSVCEFLLAAGQLAIRMALEREGRIANYSGLSREVAEMFDELSDYEPTPTNTHVPKQHRYGKG